MPQYTPGTLLQFENSGYLIGNNNLPSNCSASNMTLISPTYTGTLTTPLSSNQLILTNSSSELESSLTLPSGCSASSFSFNGELTGNLTSSSTSNNIGTEGTPLGTVFALSFYGSTLTVNTIDEDVSFTGGATFENSTSMNGISNSGNYSQTGSTTFSTGTG